MQLQHCYGLCSINLLFLELKLRSILCMDATLLAVVLFINQSRVSSVHLLTKQHLFSNSSLSNYSTGYTMLLLLPSSVKIQEIWPLVPSVSFFMTRAYQQSTSNSRLQIKNDVIDQPRLKQRKLLFLRHIYSDAAANKGYKQLVGIWKLQKIIRGFSRGVRLNLPGCWIKLKEILVHILPNL